MSFELKGIENLDPKERMDFIYLFTKGQLETEKDKVALMSNISAIIMAVVPDLNWAGFYLVKEEELVLGPFQGLPACTRLKKEVGVCAKAWRDKKLVRVDDVHNFEGHVACDSASNSELVVPLLKNKEVYGVLDLDSPLKNRFTEIEEKGFQKLIDLIQDYLA